MLKSAVKRTICMYMWKSSLKCDHNYYGKMNIFFRQINGFMNEVTKHLISRDFLCVIAFYSTFTRSKKFREINSSKNVDLTEKMLIFPFREIGCYSSKED